MRSILSHGHGTKYFKTHGMRFPAIWNMPSKAEFIFDSDWSPSWYGKESELKRSKIRESHSGRIESVAA